PQGSITRRQCYHRSNRAESDGGEKAVGRRIDPCEGAASAELPDRHVHGTEGDRRIDCTREATAGDGDHCADLRGGRVDMDHTREYEELPHPSLPNLKGGIPRFAAHGKAPRG